MMLAVPTVPVVDDPHHFTVGLLAVLLLMVVSVLVYVIRIFAQARAAAYHAQGANRAVNETGAGEHRLYDRIGHIEERLDHVAERLDHNDSVHELIIDTIGVIKTCTDNCGNRKDSTP